MVRQHPRVRIGISEAHIVQTHVAFQALKRALTRLVGVRFFKDNIGKPVQMKREQVKLYTFFEELHDRIGKILTISQEGNQHPKGKTAAFAQH